MWPTVVHVRDVRADDAIGYMRSRGAEAFTRRVCCRVGFIPSRDEEEEEEEKRGTFVSSSFGRACIIIIS